MKKRKLNIKFRPTSPNQQTLLLITCLTIGAFVGVKLYFLEGINIIIGEQQVSKNILGILKEIMLTPFCISVGIECKIYLNQAGKTIEEIKSQKAAMIGALVSFLLPTLGWSYVLYYIGYVYPIAGIVSAPTDIILALAIANILHKYIPLALRIFLMLAAVIDDVLAAMATPLLSGHFDQLYVILGILGVSSLLVWLLRKIALKQKKCLVLLLILGSLFVAHISPLLTSVVLIMFSFTKEEAVKIHNHDKLLQVLSFFGIGSFALISLDTTGLELSSLLSMECMIALVSGTLAVLGFYGVLAFVKNKKYGNQLKRLSVACLAGICMTMSLYFVEHFNKEILSEIQINSLRIGVLATSGIYAILGILFALMSGKTKNLKIA